MCLYYLKPEHYGNPLFPDIPPPTPQRIINFGNEQLTTDEIIYINTQTQFTGSIEGYGFNANICNMAGLLDYQVQIPAHVTMESNGQAGETITGELIQDFPADRNLSFDLYLIKRAAQKGVHQENAAVSFTPLPTTASKFE